MPAWRKLLDEAADDVDPRPARPRPERTVAEALSFHRAHDRIRAREQQTLARLSGGGSVASTSIDVSTAASPQLFDLLVAGVAEEAASELARGRDRPAGVVRRPPGPPPPRSWTTTRPAVLLGSAGKDASSTAIERRLPAELDSFTTAYLAPTWSELHPTRSSRPPRLLLSALLVLLRQLSPAVTPAAQSAREAVASLPRHLRELAVWVVPNRLGRGLRPEEVDALLWDLRDWGADDDDDGEDLTAGSGKNIDEGDGDDDWDAGSDSSVLGESPFGSRSQAWPTLYLPATSLPPSTLRLLLSPLPQQQAGHRMSSKAAVASVVSPVTHLSLAHAHLPVERLLALPLPGHLRALSLAGVRLVPEGYERGPGIEPRVKAVLVRLARATPLLRYLDLSSTIPRLTPALLAGPDAIDWRLQWRALDMLVLRGLGPGLDEVEGDGQHRPRPDTRASELRQATGVGKGRKWLDVVVD